MSGANLPFQLTICGLDELDDRLSKFTPSHIVSILDPNDDRDEPLVFDESIKVLSLRFFDVHQLTGVVGTLLSARDRGEYPCVDHAQAIIDFGRTIPAGAKVLFHCWAGISRSTAAAYLLARLHLPEADAMKLVMALRPGAIPNKLIMQFGNKILGADGRMPSTSGDQRRAVSSRSIRSSNR